MTKETKIKKIYLTVDTECHNISNINKTIYGKTKSGESFGIEKILQLGKELDVPVNVFLDIPECHRYGDEHIQAIINLVNKYEQPIFLHVHPDYIGDKNKKHLWEYTEDEQRNILRIALDDYYRFCGPHEKIVFRAGAWGVNDTTYKVLREQLPESQYEIIDLSYVYKSNWRCRLSYDEYGAANAARKYRGINILPNTTYIGFDYFGKTQTTSFSVPNPNFSVFKRIIDNNTLHDITFTMHSWDFIKRWFFLPKHIAGDKYLIWKFKKCVKYARQHGYKFENLNNYTVNEDTDQCQNLCKGIGGKLRCLWYNFFSFALIGRSYRKYALLYFSPVIILLTIMLFLLIN